MKPIVLSLLIASCTFAAAAWAHEGESAGRESVSPGDPQARPAVEVVERFSEALRTADFKRIGGLLAEDVLILESGGAERSRDEYLRHHAIADAAFLKGAHVRTTRRSAHVEGTFAWVGSESEIHVTKDGKPMVLLSTETMILKQGKDGWRIVHIHWSSRPGK